MKSKFLVLIIGLLFSLGNPNISGTEVNATLGSSIEEGITDYAIKEVLIWKGDILGIYEDRQFIKVRISRNYKLPQSIKSQSDFKNEILSQSWKIYQKDSKSIIGEFRPRDLVWERKSQKPDKTDEEWEAKIWGEVELLEGIHQKYISLNSFIAKFKSESIYLEPHNFFGKKLSPLPKRIIHIKDGKEMVLVTRGIFLYGQGINSSEASFHPEYYRPTMGNLMELEPFYIDKYEVTNDEYLRFLNETNTRPPRHWRDGKYSQGERDHPVDYLSYEEVRGYATWAGKKIPTEWEWEKAARGSGVDIFQNKDETLGYYINATPYPYGSSFDSSYCNTIETGLGRSMSVYELPKNGESPYGAIGMCGNVAEWTNSWYGKYPGQPYELRGYGKFYKVIRGGSFRDSSKEARVFHRSYGGIPNLFEDRRAGFRLVKEAK